MRKVRNIQQYTVRQKTPEERGEAEEDLAIHFQIRPGRDGC